MRVNCNDCTVLTEEKDTDVRKAYVYILSLQN